MSDENNEFARSVSHVSSPYEGLGRLSGKERVTEDRKQTGLRFATSAFERIDRWTNPNVNKIAVRQHFLPGCTRQTTGNSSRP